MRKIEIRRVIQSDEDFEVLLSDGEAHHRTWISFEELQELSRTIRNLIEEEQINERLRSR